jgi:hypothetical protein
VRNDLRVIPSAARDLLFNSCAVAVCTLGLVTAFSLNAQAQEPVPLARGNAPGEPHHHLKIENEYVRVYYVEVPPHEATQLHQHDHDYIYVSLGPSDVINAVLYKPEVHLVFKDGETHFTRGGFAHVARNLSDAPFRNVTIELLKPQGHARNKCEPVIDGPVDTCSSEVKGLPPNSPLLALAHGMRKKPLFETDQISLGEESIALKMNYSCSDPNASQLLIVDEGTELGIDQPGQPSQTLHGGEMLWIDAGKKVTIVTVGSYKNNRFFLIRFKKNEESRKP